MLYIISGPSGAGKGTIVQGLLVRRPDIVLSVSFTTRPPRPTERDGEHYYFVSPTTFSLMRQRGDFVECAEVHGNYYGTSRRTIEEALASGRDVLLEIDVQGAAQVKSRAKDAVSIFVLPPSRQVLQNRLRNRSLHEGAAAEAVIERRLLAAQKEIENSPNYDYILVNDRLEESVEKLKAIVFCERAKRSGKSLSQEEQRVMEMARNCLQSDRETSKNVKEVLASFAPAISG